MTPAEFTQAIADVTSIVTCAITGNDVACLPPALDLLKRLADALPPIDAPALDPADRAEVDAEIKVEEDAKFPK